MYHSILPYSDKKKGREHYRAYYKQIYQENKNGYRDKKLVRARTEESKAYMRAYSKKRFHGPKREELLAKRREYAKKLNLCPRTKEQIAARLLLRSRKRARFYNREFNLTKEFILSLLQKYTVCPVLGIKDSPSLDRFDSSKGYTQDNVIIIGRRANLLKSNSTVEELEKILRYMKTNGSGAKACP